MDPAQGGLSQAIRSSATELGKLGIFTEVVSCDSPEVSWLGHDAFPIHALGPRKYGSAYTPRLGPWLQENLSRFEAVIVDGLWLWPSTCAVRAVLRERRRRKAIGERQEVGGGPVEYASHSTGQGGGTKRPVAQWSVLRSSRAKGAESLKPKRSTLNLKQLRCFVMPHGMLDPWFQRDKSRRVKAVRNWFYWWLVERSVVNSADALLFTCLQELELARTTFGGYRPKKEIIVGLGVEEPPAFELEMRKAFAQRCPGLNERPYLLFMSRIHAKKNIAALVRAYARVRSEVTSDEIRGLARQPLGNKVTVELFPDLVVAGPGWESDYGRKVRGLIDAANSNFAQSSSTLDLKLKTSHSAPIHAVGMLSGAEKWGALYGCEAFVLPSHQENFGIAVVEALACGKPVLISDQVNIWREILEDDAGLVEADTEEGVVKLLRKFHNARSDEGGTEDRTVADGATRHFNLIPETRTKARKCYLERLAIGPAAAKLAQALSSES